MWQQHAKCGRQCRYTFVLKCEADDSQQVTITGGDGSNTKRVVVTQVDIYSATSDASKMMLTLPAKTDDADEFIFTDITNKFYNVTGLTEGGTYTYRVKAHYVNGTQSAWSNVETVTLTGSAVVIGDVDNDGEVRIADVAALIDYLVGGDDINQANADTNGDTVVSIADVAALIDILLSAN